MSKAVNGKTLGREQLLAGVPEVKTETVELPELGGSVVVRGMQLAEWLYVLGIPQAKGDTVAHLRYAAHMLACCVVDAAGKPLMTADEWERFGGANRDSAVLLVAAAQRLSQKALPEKKETSAPS